MSQQKGVINSMTCPLCNSFAVPSFALTHTQVWRCTGDSCRLQFAWPQLNDQDLREAYEKFYYPGGDTEEHFDPTSEGVLRQFFESVRATHPDLAGKRILDYGCGPAVLARVAKEYGMIPTGIEPDANARQKVRATKLCPVYANVDELRQANPDARFDWIVLWNVIEHLRSPWLEVCKLRQVCAPKARLIVTTPNADCLRGRLLGARWDQRMNLTHFYYFTRRSLAATLRAAGFSAIVSQNKFTAYPHHGVLRRFAQRVLVSCRLDGKLEFSAVPAADPLPNLELLRDGSTL
jgi:2-polyprenyl-3-methyl-5-hydroxy-6-metoxy-1,4-benzoquinol methylase